MKRPGRPPLDPMDPAVDIHLRLPSQQYDEVYKSARLERLSVPEWIRRRIADFRTQTRKPTHNA